MTNAAVYELAKTMYDEARNPTEVESRFAARYENARLAWQEWHFRQFEVSEESRSALRFFLRQKSLGSVSKVSLIHLKNEMRFIEGLVADFNFNCLGKTNRRTVPIKAKPISHGLMNLNDAWNQPSDSDPYYIELGAETEGMNIEVLSTNTPMDLTLFYVKYPKPFGLINDPFGSPEEDDAAIKSILNYTLKSQEYTFENYNRFKAIDGIEN